MLVLYSELELNEATPNGVIMSPPPFFLYGECSRECHFRGGLNVQIECLTNVSDMFRIRVD